MISEPQSWWEYFGWQIWDNTIASDETIKQRHLLMEQIKSSQIKLKSVNKEKSVKSKKGGKKKKNKRNKHIKRSTYCEF